MILYCRRDTRYCQTSTTPVTCSCRNMLMSSAIVRCMVFLRFACLLSCGEQRAPTSGLATAIDCWLGFSLMRSRCHAEPRERHTAAIRQRRFHEMPRPRRSPRLDVNRVSTGTSLPEDHVLTPPFPETPMLRGFLPSHKHPLLEITTAIHFTSVGQQEESQQGNSGSNTIVSRTSPKGATDTLDQHSVRKV